MKGHHISFCIFIFFVNAFTVFSQDNPSRGPLNILNGGVVDGVVVKDEIPIRSKVEYEHVRLADYVWSKRVFSRIDGREKLNHPIFHPNDYFIIICIQQQKF